MNEPSVSARCPRDGCDHSAHSRGLCKPHYDYARNHGLPLPPRQQRERERVSVAQRMEKYTQRSDGCWVWSGTINRTTGYGSLTVERKSRYAHRLAWELDHGPIPAGLCVLHRCDNRRCVRPDHLFLGTFADNTRDMMAKGEARQHGPPVVFRQGRGDACRARARTPVAC